MSNSNGSILSEAFQYSNIVLGIFSILLAINGSFKISAVLILAASFFCAHRSKKQPSLYLFSDSISLGAAPALLMYLSYDFSNLGIYGYIIALVFPVAAAYKCAAAISGGISPATAGAGLAIFVFITADKPVVPSVAIIFTAALSYLMVSKYKIKIMP